MRWICVYNVDMRVWRGYACVALICVYGIGLSVPLSAPLFVVLIVTLAVGVHSTLMSSHLSPISIGLDVALANPCVIHFHSL